MVLVTLIILQFKDQLEVLVELMIFSAICSSLTHSASAKTCVSLSSSCEKCIDSFHTNNPVISFDH